MLVTETAWGKRIKTDVLILGTGASGVGAALRAAELKADVLMVGQGRLESSGCITVYTVEHNGRLRKYYKITPSGMDKIRLFLTEWKEIMKAYEFIKEEYGNE